MINYEVQKVYVKMRKYEAIKLEAKRSNLEKILLNFALKLKFILNLMKALKS